MTEASKDSFVLAVKEIATGIQLCIDNSLQLIKEARLLYDNGYFARSLSLCVLALEEVGKAIYLDSLVFRHTDDKEWLNNFRKKIMFHKSKLSVIDWFPVWLNWWVHLINDPKLNRTVAIILTRYKERRLCAEQLFPEIKNKGITYLDELKKAGFYVDLREEFVSPLTLSQDKVEVVLQMSFDIVDLVQFVLKRTLNRYVQFATEVRTQAGASLKKIQYQLEGVFKDAERCAHARA